ncbi:MAG: hypothetical protein RL292_345, partial [Candidatus Parcubacteria bacterium]
KQYVEDIVRVCCPYTELDAEIILESFERIHQDYFLDEPIFTISEVRLNEMAHLLGAITEGKIHLLHHEKTGRMHTGIRGIHA